MMRVSYKPGYISAVVLFLAIPSLFAQTIEIDSLQRTIRNLQGTERIDALNALAFRQILVDFKLADAAIQEAMLLSQGRKYTKGLAEAHTYKGICEVQRGNRAQAQQLLEKGIGYARDARLRGLEGYAVAQLGNLYRITGIYDSAQYEYDQSYAILRDSLNPWQLSVVYRNLGVLNKLTNQPQLELRYLMKAYAIRRRLPDKILYADILLLLAQWHIRQGEFDVADRFLEKADSITDVPPETQKDISYQRAIVLFNEAKYLEGLRLLNEVNDFFLSQENYVSYVNTTIEIADLLEELGSNDLSMTKCYEALAVCQKKDLKKEELRTKLVMSWNFYDTRQFHQAEDTTRNVLNEARQRHFEVEEAAADNLLGLLLTENKQYDLALLHFSNGLKLRTRLNDHTGRANILANMGDTYYEMHNYRHAIGLINKSIYVMDSIGGNTNASWAHIGWNYLRLSKLYSAMNDYTRALEYVNKAESRGRLSRNWVTRNLKDFQILLYEERRKILIGQDKTREALQLSLLLEQLKDSLADASISDRIVGLQASYELDKQAREIRLRNNEIENQRGEIREKEIIIVSILIVSLLLMVLLYLSYTYYRKTQSLNNVLRERNAEIQAQSEKLSRTNDALQTSNRQLAEKNEEIQTQSEELIEANSTLSQLNQVLADNKEELEAQSTELRVSHQIIAEMNESLQRKVQERTLELQQAFKELDTFFYRSSHDFRRPLTTFMGLAEVAKITVTEKNALDLFAKVKETAVNLDRMLIKLQSISDVGAEQFVVKPIDIKVILESSIQNYSEAIEATRTKVILKVDNIRSLITYPAFVKIIVDNLLENALQFSKRENAQVLLEVSEKDGGVELLVKDNGIGIEDEYKDRVFDMFFRGSEYSKGNGLGLYIVKKAVEKLQGMLFIESTYQVGTTVRIWFPHRLA